MTRPGRAAAARPAVAESRLVELSDGRIGYALSITVKGIEAIVRPVTSARTWLLTEGWLRHGRISVHEVPATA